jgi:Adenylate cyclase, family 3 (some proteins contain HAMP domain)
MHRRLQELLPKAQGFSDFVVVVFLDVRGFSSFARMAESSEAAVFLRNVYVKILRDYYPDAAFFKPTGDGLMIILHYDEDSLGAVVNGAAESALRLVDDFPGLCEDDPMVNFDVPRDLGVGIARGAATRLASDGLVLDYSGRALNLAARLMDIARPRGVVFNESLGVRLLERATSDRFAKDEVYVRGISEDRPMRVFVSTGQVEVLDRYRQPPTIARWERFEDGPRLLSEIAERGRFRHKAAYRPISGGVLYASAPKAVADGSASKSLQTVHQFEIEYSRFMGEHCLVADYAKVVASLRKSGVKPNWPVSILVEYETFDPPIADVNETGTVSP